MKIYKIVILSLFFAGFFTSCFEDQDDVIGNASELEIKDFIWKGLNAFYLYKAEQPDLANDRFATQGELNDFLQSYETPGDLFYGLRVEQDQFSFLVTDYIALEQALDGISRSTGMEAGFAYLSEGSSEILGYVRYVLPNTSAANQGVERGMVFTSVDGVTLTETNYVELISSETFTIELASLSNGQITPTGETITLQSEQYSENPVHITEVVEIENEKIGYLMYNGFTGSYDAELNAAFANFQAQGITELVLDLRYNGGGSVETAKDLASMITGQFTGEIFSTEQWNAELQDYWEQENPDRLVNRFDTQIRTNSAINSLGLNRVYVLTTRSSASASELLINGLNPYIDVVQIGTNTRGKFQASITLYDSPDFGRQGANPGHRYAMQPLVLKSVNANGVTDYIEGLTPDILLPESIGNLGTLGNPQEPLFAAAINHILGEGNAPDSFMQPMEVVGETGMKNILHQKMYVEPVEGFQLPINN